MERRNFLKAAAASLLAALTPFKAHTVQEPKALADGFAFDFAGPSYDEHLYVVEKAVLAMEDSPAFLLQDVAMSVYVPKPEVVGTKNIFNRIAYCQVTAGRMVGPYGHACRFYTRFGDLANIETNSLKLGIVRLDNSPLWVGLEKCLIFSIGMSVCSNTDKPVAERMLISEQLQFRCDGEPTLTDGSRKRDITAVTDEEILKAVRFTPGAYVSPELLTM